VTDDELIQGLREAARREERELGEIERSQRLDPDLVERSAARVENMLRAGAPRPRAAAPATRRRAALWGGLAAAAAIALGVAFGRGGSGDLPGYELALLAGGAESQRSLAQPDPSAIRARAGSVLDVVARPARRVTGAVEARAFLVHDGRAAAWDGAVEVTPEGTVRVRGRLDDRLPVEQGSWAIAVVVAPVGALPRDPQALARAAEDGPGDGSLRVARAPIVAQSGP